MKSLEFGSAEWLLKHADLVSAWVSLYEPFDNEIEFPAELHSLGSGKPRGNSTGTHSDCEVHAEVAHHCGFGPANAHEEVDQACHAHYLGVWKSGGLHWENEAVFSQKERSAAQS